MIIGLQQWSEKWQRLHQKMSSKTSTSKFLLQVKKREPCFSFQECMETTVLQKNCLCQHAGQLDTETPQLWLHMGHGKFCPLRTASDVHIISSGKSCFGTNAENKYCYPHQKLSFCSTSDESQPSPRELRTSCSSLQKAFGQMRLLCQEVFWSLHKGDHKPY